MTKTNSVFRFNSLYINLLERKLLRDNLGLKTSSKEFDLLQILIQRKGEIVTKEEILGMIWNGSFVEEGNLAVLISKLRKLLGSTKNEPIIETVSGTGYRFVARINEISETEWNEIYSKQSQNNAQKEIVNHKTKSIAVLPLKNESNNLEIDYLADGLTESFINSLSQETELKVMSRNAVFRFKNSPESIQEVGCKLGVDAILTGRIRLISDRLILSLELTKVSDNSQIWGTQFNRHFSDIFDVQEKIIEGISERLVSEAISKTKSSKLRYIHRNQKSYYTYLKGRYYYEKRTKDFFYKAITCFQDALLSNPQNLYAYAGLIDSYVLLYVDDHITYAEGLAYIAPILRQIAKEANSNKKLAELEAAQGHFKLCFELDIVGAEECYKTAIDLDPNYLIARYRYSHILLYCGKFFEALDQVNKIIELDQFSPIANIRIARIFLNMDNYEKASELLKESLELDPNYPQALNLLGITQNCMGEHENALINLQKSYEVLNDSETLAFIAQTQVFLKREDLAQIILAELETESKSKSIPAMFKAYIYLALNDVEKVFECLDEAYLQKDFEILMLNVLPFGKRIRKDKRFLDLLRKIGLPAD